MTTCTAPTPAAATSCTATDWPPMTPWQRYRAERLAGLRVPPTVSTWTERDRQRQAAAERRILGLHPEPVLTPWGSCS